MPTRIWDLESGKILMRFHDPGVRAVAFSPDGKSFAPCPGQTAGIEVFDSASGDDKGGFRASQTTSIAFTPDGKGLASGDVQGLIKLWDLKLTSPIGFRHRTRDSWHLAVVFKEAVAFHPDGKLIATGCRAMQSVSGTIRATSSGPGRDQPRAGITGKTPSGRWRSALTANRSWPARVWERS